MWVWWMKNKLDCPICDKEVFSGVGEGCKMCGMVMLGFEDFCCKLCMRKYNSINRMKVTSEKSHLENIQRNFMEGRLLKG